MNKLRITESIIVSLFYSASLFAAEPNVVDPSQTTQPATQKRFVFNPQLHRWFAYDELGKEIASGNASGGKDWCADIGASCRTPAGEYYVSSKKGPGCKSSQFPIGKGGAPMPYCMFFHQGIAIHGSNDVPDRNASHGCVRVETKDAKWLSENFIEIGTRIVVEPYAPRP